MKSLLAILFVFISVFANAQDIKVFSERSEKGYAVFASNNEILPVSISLDLDLVNLTFSEGGQKEFVIPAKSDKHKLGELAMVSGAQKIKVSFKYLYVLGDILKKDYDKDYEYDLPFQKGKSFNVYQGYNGSLSHRNENAIDFTMPEGTEILAARDGVVAMVVQNNSEGCPRQECQQYNNYISIYHADGTFASYVHIKYNGSKVKVGDQVKKGQVIAYSGNTGWTTGPHLHFVTYIPTIEKNNSIPTKFRLDNGNRSDYLKERNTYTRSY
jgi:murein DD-endopeptidase MepM/ murein hydrolase activator NlpD